MRAVRYLLRVSVLMLVGAAVFCGLVLLLNAQVLLNRYAELYMMDAEVSSTPILNGLNGAPNNEPLNTERVAIHVNDAASIAAVTAADRRVDVILTHQLETGAAFSEAVLENVKVLGIESVSGGGERAAVHAVTLDVDSETIGNLLLASRSGRLSLTLHRPIDKPPLDAHQITGAATTESHGADVASNTPSSATDVRASAGAEVADVRAVNALAANRPDAEPDDESFTVITVNRAGGQSSIHRVPRER